MSDDAIRTILTTATWAPNGTNAQPWESIVIKDPDVADPRCSCQYCAFCRRMQEMSARCFVFNGPEMLGLSDEDPTGAPDRISRTKNGALVALPVPLFHESSQHLAHGTLR